MKRANCLLFILLYLFLQSVSCCYAESETFLNASGGSSSPAPSIPQIQLNSWQLMGKVKGTAEFFHTLPVGQEVVFEVVLPQHLSTTRKKEMLLKLIESGEYKEHLEDLEHRNIHLKDLLLWYELANIEQAEKNTAHSLEPHIRPLFSIRKGSITFFNQQGRMTFLPEREILVQPSDTLPERRLKLYAELGAHLSVYKNNFSLLLNDARSLDEQPRAYMDYCVFRFPVRQEGNRYIARIRMKISEDFEGEIGPWEYITHADMF